MKDNDPEFWAELTRQETEDPVDEDAVVPEDTLEDEDGEGDDSNVPVDELIAHIVEKRTSLSFASSDELNGGLIDNSSAEAIDGNPFLPEGEDTNVERLAPSAGGEGRGKRTRKANTLYGDFWKH